MKLFSFTALFLTTAFTAFARPQIVAAQTVLADLVKAIGGEAFDVTCLLPANVDPHSYEPAPSDLRRLVDADVVIINGLGLEPWADRLIDHSGFHGRLVNASDGCPHRWLLATDDNGTAYPGKEYDPHAWHDIANVIHYVQVIRDALEKIAPSETVALQKRTDDYVAKLRVLDAYARAQISTLPPERRKLVTSHDSLQYLAKAYGLTIVAIAGSRPEQEPSARELARLITLIREQHVPAVFFEPTSSPKLAQLVADEAHVTVVRELCTDGLGAAGTRSATYLGMFKTNIDTIVAALR